MINNSASPPAVRRVAELASQLAAIDPNATEMVRELFRLFSEVQEHFRRPEPIETAPQEAGAPSLLYCPEQHGWQVGSWDTNLAHYVATIDPAIALLPTHWMRPAAAPTPGDADKSGQEEALAQTG